MIKMINDDIEPFKGRDITLVLTDNFRLDGTILKVTYDCILFQTKQKTSLINISSINQIVAKSTPSDR